jgi:hypothetical protein
VAQLRSHLVGQELVCVRLAHRTYLCTSRVAQPLPPPPSLPPHFLQRLTFAHRSMTTVTKPPPRLDLVPGSKVSHMNTHCA